MVTDLQKRFILFIFGCLGTRLYLVYLAKLNDPSISKLLIALSLIFSVGFITIYAFNLRKTGLETLGSPIWWNHLRPFHALTFGLYSYLTYINYEKSWIILLFDTIVGAISFFNYHYF
tara:strand:+ start:17099 stop:17452 length:354 start_codon:yes stop_codon:yes gene_type:complete